MAVKYPSSEKQPPSLSGACLNMTGMLFLLVGCANVSTAWNLHSFSPEIKHIQTITHERNEENGVSKNCIAQSVSALTLPWAKH